MPRPPNQPQVTEDAAENAARDRRTVRELYDEAIAEGWRTIDMPEEPIDFDAIIARIGRRRWRQLRRRRDKLLAQLREARDDG